MANTNKTIYGLFNDSFPPVLDGVTLTVVNYTKWLVEAGKPVSVVTPWHPVDIPHPNYDIYRYFSIPVYNRKPYRYGYPLFDYKIWRKMREVPFKIVHAHCPFSSGRLARYAANYHKVPLVATFHSKYRDDLKKGLIKPIFDFVMKRLVEFYNTADAVWIPQASVEETLREYGITAPVTVVENGNDFVGDVQEIKALKQQARLAHNIPDSKLVLLFVGQHIEAKGVMIIIDSLRLLADRGIDFEMHFAGTGNHVEAMKRRCQSLNIDKYVTFHGVIQEREKLRDLYMAADLFLFPSFYDNAPLVVREAAAMLTPSILPIGSTSAENIVNGENGFLTHTTAKDYADVVASLASDRGAISHAGQGAHNTICRSWQDVVNEVIGRYDKIISRYYSR